MLMPAKDVTCRHLELLIYLPFWIGEDERVNRLGLKVTFLFLNQICSDMPHALVLIKD